MADLNPDTWWSNTFYGKKFRVFAPRLDDVCYGDIEHSVNVMKLVLVLGGTMEDARWGLLHDATEAYMGDMIKPMKDHPSMSFFKETERRLMEVIALRFGLESIHEPAIVKKADYMMLRIESDLLVPNKPAPWNVPEVDDMIRDHINIQCHERESAKLLFRAHFKSLFPAYV